MDTYGDMVTLLLTFFVMLYAISNVDAKKWDVFVRSISTPGQEAAEEILINSEVTEVDDTETEVGIEGETLGSADADVEPIDPSKLGTLYLKIADKLNDIGVEGAVVMRGEDYTYVRFENSTFFNGGSSLITVDGLKVLDAFCESIAPAAEGISQINIMAHTAKANAESNVRTDRMLSAMRAAEVSIYIQQKHVIEPEKLVNISFGEYRPIADNTTAEGRAKNRRIEFILLDKDAKEMGLDAYYEDLKAGIYQDTTVFTVGNTEAEHAEEGNTEAEHTEAGNTEVGNTEEQGNDE